MSNLEDALHPSGKLLEFPFDGIRNVGLATCKSAAKQAHLLLLVQVPALLPRQYISRYVSPGELSAVVITQLRPELARNDLHHAAMIVKA